jgi:hypothetical protein
LTFSHGPTAPPHAKKVLGERPRPIEHLPWPFQDPARDTQAGVPFRYNSDLDSYYFVSQQPAKSLIDSLLPVLPTAAIALLALIFTTWIALRQIQIQRWQLNKDLFDRRFAVFTETREFLVYVGGKGGWVEPYGPEYNRFRETMERADMLFPSEVHAYLVEIDKATRDLLTAKQTFQAKPGDATLPQKIHDLEVNFYETISKRRTEIFRPDLQMPPQRRRKRTKSGGH